MTMAEGKILFIVDVHFFNGKSMKEGEGGIKSDFLTTSVLAENDILARERAIQSIEYAVKNHNKKEFGHVGEFRIRYCEMKAYEIDHIAQSEWEIEPSK